ncbi:MAG: tetratricopeptide repeat protein [Caulobacterales bacterium]
MTATGAPATSRLRQLVGFLHHDPANLQLIGEAAAAALDEGELSQADDLLAGYARLAPLPPALSNLAGLVALSDGRFEAAAVIFQQLLPDNPSDPALRFNLAWCRAMLKDYAGASAILDEQAASASPQAALLKVQMLHHLGELEAALDWGARLVQRFSGDPALLGALAAVAIDAEDVGLAERYALGAGENHDALATLGMLRLNEDSVDDALKLFNRALGLDPHDPRALLGEGLGLLAKGELRAAPPLIDQAAERFEHHLGSWVAAGWAYFVNGDYISSRARFDKALALDDTFAETHGGLAVLDAVEGDLAGAKRRTEVALRLDRKCFSAALAKSLILISEGDPTSAARVRNIALNAPIGPGGRTIAQALLSLGTATRQARGSPFDR